LLQIILVADLVGIIRAPFAMLLLLQSTKKHQKAKQYFHLRAFTCVLFSALAVSCTILNIVVWQFGGPLDFKLATFIAALLYSLWLILDLFIMQQLQKVIGLLGRSERKS
jgi:hypothetical protein